ncbi:SusD/RagB family nutrient-binding outer membrane lipoprotein [Paludibacter sp.]
MKKFIFLILFSVLFIGCEGVLDVNKDPNNPENVPITLLLPAIELNATYAFVAGEGIGQDLGVYMHQLSTREEANEYGADGTEYYLGRSWNYTYVGALQNIEALIAKADEMEAPHYAGVAKILKAYLFSQYVDIFGKIPFSEANKKNDGIIYPTYDDGKDIYPEIIKLLNDGITDLKKDKGSYFPATDDLIFGGNATKWIKTANTIKLKLFNQVRLLDAASVSPITGGTSLKDAIDALLADPNSLMGATDDGFMFPFTSKRTPDERNPAYTDIYEATQKSTHISPWFFEIMKGLNPVFSGIQDPRVPYYFYNQLNATMAGRDGNSFEYRVGGFTTIYFGSKGPDRDKSQDKSFAVYGIYPAGGRFDAGDAKQVGAESGTGAAPYRFLTYADRLFIEAELMQTNVIVGDARAKLESAMKEAFKQVDYVVTKAKLSDQTIPALNNAATTTTYINSILALYDAGNDDKKLEIIMTQKWISSFGSYVDQYTDYRRTGYPVLFDPNNVAHAPGGYVTPPAGGDPDRTLPPVRVTCSKNYPKSLAWPMDELNVNKNAPTQKADPSTYSVFWDK